jgi:hypothetical protein
VTRTRVAARGSCDDDAAFVVVHKGNHGTAVAVGGKLSPLEPKLGGGDGSCSVARIVQGQASASGCQARGDERVALANDGAAAEAQCVGEGARQNKETRIINPKLQTPNPKPQTPNLMSSLPIMSTSHTPRPFISGNLPRHVVSGISIEWERRLQVCGVVQMTYTSEFRGEKRGGDGRMRWIQSKVASALPPEHKHQQQRHTHQRRGAGGTEKVVSTVKFPVLQ